MSRQRTGFDWLTIHGGLFLLCFVLVACLPVMGWPWYLLLPMAGYLILALLITPLRGTIPAIAVGRLDRIGIVGAVALLVVSSAVLLGYQHTFNPPLTSLAANLPVAAFGSLVLAGICFSIVNAVLEELMCRWVLYEAVAVEWGSAAAIVVTSAFFGIAHMQGYPPGPLGAILAGGYGVGLGLLRWWTGGLALPIICHIGADATIFWIMASAGAFGES